jgi:hypothetical protein
MEDLTRDIAGGLLAYAITALGCPGQILWDVGEGKG